jgi:hypothetical protein
MTPRSIRRAQERKALKEARKAEQRQLTDAQLEANRANAQLSTGPKTAEGKAKISLNAIKTGLTGRTVLLPGDDVESYNAAAARVRRAFNPVGEDEEAFVQSLIDTQWRLDRIPGLESAIYAVAMRRLADQFPDIEDETARLALIRGEAYLQHFRELSNLSIQETRLLRRREKDTAALLELQRKRQEAEREAAVASQPAPPPAMTYAPEPPPSNFGFEFSSGGISDGIDTETRQLNADYRELMRIVERQKLHG